MNPLLLEYLKQETSRAQLHPHNLILYSKAHGEILQMDESMSGYEDMRNHILTTMWNANGDEGWEQYDYDETKPLPDNWAKSQLESDKKFRNREL